MKRLITYWSLCLLIFSAGCKKFLEKSPDNRTELNSPDKVSQLLGTAYPAGSYVAFAESLSDNVTDDQQDSPEWYWAACYSAVAAANQALEACKNASDPASYSSQQGEALLS